MVRIWTKCNRVQNRVAPVRGRKKNGTRATQRAEWRAEKKNRWNRYYPLCPLWSQTHHTGVQTVLWGLSVKTDKTLSSILRKVTVENYIFLNQQVEWGQSQCYSVFNSKTNQRSSVVLCCLHTNNIRCFILTWWYFAKMSWGHMLGVRAENGPPGAGV